MSWPLPQDFNEAIQNPAASFNDPDLLAAQPILGAQGLPLPRSGNFADVYQVRSPDGRDWAVKCFTRAVTGLEQRYTKISEALNKAGLPFTVSFTFLPSGIRVRGQWYPVVKMEWVEGLLLSQVVRDSADRAANLSTIGQMWGKLCQRLRESAIAHADIQHGNVLLVPGSRSGSYGLKLIDYDGMYVSSLANRPSGEGGHPNFQHPARFATRAYSPDLDRFPHLVVATALRALEEGGTALWERYDTGDNLLFVEEDFKTPSRSPLMRELWQTGGPAVRALVGRLAIACLKPIPQTPWLDQIVPDGQPTPLDAGTTRAAEAALGLGASATVVRPPPPARVPAREGSAQPVIETEPVRAPKRTRRLGTRILDDEPEEPVRRTGTRRVARKKKKPLPLGVSLVVLGLLVFAAAGIGLVVVLGHKKPAETVESTRSDLPEATASNSQPSTALPTTPSPTTPLPPAPKSNVDPGVVSPPSTPAKPGGAATTPKVEPPKSDPKPNAPAPAPSTDKEIVILKPRWSTPMKANGSVPAWIGFESATDAAFVWPLGFDLRTGALMLGFDDLRRFRSFSPFFLDRGRMGLWDRSGSEIIVWSIKSGQPDRSMPPITIPSFSDGENRSWMRDVALSPNGQYLAAGRTPGLPPPPPGTLALVVADTATRQPILTSTWDGGKLYFTSDSSRLLIAEKTGRHRWIKMPSGQLDGEWSYPPPPPNKIPHVITSASHDGRVLGYKGMWLGREGGSKIINGVNGEVIVDSPDRSRSVDHFVVSGNGQRAAYFHCKVGVEGAVDVLELPSGVVIARAPLVVRGDYFRGRSIALSSDGRCLLVLDSECDCVLLFDLPNGGPLTAAAAAVRTPPPAEDAQAKSLKEIRNAFKDEFARKTSSDKKVLALKLWTTAEETKDEPTARYVLLQEAQNLAVEIGDAALAMQTVEALILGYEVDAAALRTTVLEKLASGSASRAAHDAAKTAAASAFVAGDYAMAARLAGIAVTAARKSNLGTATIQEGELMAVQAKKWNEGLAALKPALEILKATPNDPEANLTIGRFQCFVQGKWDEGLKHLAKGTDAGLKAAAEAERTAGSGTPDARVAEAWQDAAQSVREADRWAVDARRRYWDARVAASLTGFARLKVENRLSFTAGGVEYRPGLAADFQTHQRGVAKVKKSRIDSVIDFVTTEFADPTGGQQLEVTGKWTGAILPPRAGVYKLVADSTDVIRLRVDGKIVFETTAKGANIKEGIAILGERPTPLSVEFTGPVLSGHKLKLKWAAPGGNEEVIPAECLVHDRKAETSGGK